MDQIAYEYSPIIYMDRLEPFAIKRVGFSQYFTDGERSRSFNRSFDFQNFKGAVKVLEYAYYLDYDIQHLYDLEHIWIYLNADGEVVGAEGSYHGRFLNAMNRTFGAKGVQKGNHIKMYSQPGKHAMLSDPSLMYLYTELYEACDRLSGISGLDAPECFLKDIKISEEENTKVKEYIHNNFSFKPSMEFEEAELITDIYEDWDELAEQIPGFIREELGKIL